MNYQMRAYKHGGQWYIIAPVSMFPVHLLIMLKIKLSLIMWLLLFNTARADINIVTSIEPLALIAHAIVGDRGQVRSLVDPRQSAHDYSMRPSDRVAIQQAALLIWVDPRFEVYLADIFAAQSRNKTVITFSELSDVTLIHEASGELDPHMWLNTQNARHLANEVTRFVVNNDAPNRAYFQANLEKVMNDLDALDEQITRLFVDESQKSYGVYHNAYQYFEDQFDLSHVLNMLEHPEIQPTGQEIIAVRNIVQKQQLNCVFLEFDSNMAVVDTMLNGVQVQMPVLDIMGHNLTTRDNGYIDLLDELAAQFARCLY